MGKHVVRLLASKTKEDRELVGHMCRATKGVWRGIEADLVKNLNTKWAKDY